MYFGLSSSIYKTRKLVISYSTYRDNNIRTNVLEYKKSLTISFYGIAARPLLSWQRPDLRGFNLQHNALSLFCIQYRYTSFSVSYPYVYRKTILTIPYMYTKIIVNKWFYILFLFYNPIDIAL